MKEEEKEEIFQVRIPVPEKQVTIWRRNETEKGAMIYVNA